MNDNIDSKEELRESLFIILIDLKPIKRLN